MRQERQEHKSKRRMFTILLVVFLMWGSLVGRLGWIQLVDTRSFSTQGVDLIEKSVSQRKRQILLDTGRGAIYDRYGRPFTGKSFYTLVVFPLKQYPFEKDPKLAEVAKIAGLSRNIVLNQIEEMKGPGVISGITGEPVELTKKEADRINSLSLAGLRAMPYNERYSEDMIARHVIGYIGQNPEYIKSHYAKELEEGVLGKNSVIGVAGLEKTFQPFLHGLGPTLVSYYVNGKNDPLRGLKIRYNQPDNPFYPLSVVTTIDYDIQQIVEAALDHRGIRKGAAVVLDVDQADILAMASRPNFAPNAVNPADGHWSNRAVKQIVPGSVFKTVIAAAALEKGLYTPESIFHDETGFFGKYKLRSWKTGGHGTVTFEQAYAESCNVCFAQIAMNLTADEIEEYSRKLGLLEPVGWKTDHLYKLESFSQIDGEDQGQLFADPKIRNDEGVRVQTSIGQRDVRMTPLQAANMVVTLLQRGERYYPRLVKRIDYANGTSFHSFPVKKAEEVERLKPYTAYQLLRMMRSVVTDGTGSVLKDSTWKLAGKSGTAQVNVGNTEKNNQWFVGFGPADSPRYVVVVVAEHVDVSEQRIATLAFKEIMEGLASLSR